MKKSFKGKEIAPKSDIWQEKSYGAKYLSADIILLSSTEEHIIKAYIHPEYAVCEYKLKLNIFSFGKLKFNIPFTVIAPPISVDEVGFVGDLVALIEDYSYSRGLFLMLNLKSKEIDVKRKVALGLTLPSCIFYNRFASFDDYLNALRSNYRRRIKIALEKGKNLKINRIENLHFDKKLYNLYLQVLDKSKFPLAKLPMRFFQSGGYNIDVFYLNDHPLAFVMYENDLVSLNFIFGGMDYKQRDEFDLYYNMLLHLAKVGIETNVKRINFGQTAEITKCRIGCVLENRYMLAFSSNRFLNTLLCYFAPFLQNNNKIIEPKVFKV